mmetsp:Transcript_40646/g.81428  ORF Transcript_40646/g.81428 Transcript_40646/m.81428 type:complete len:235 (-) Transcript_40646:295-999(-)
MLLARRLFLRLHGSLCLLALLLLLLCLLCFLLFVPSEGVDHVSDRFIRPRLFALLRGQSLHRHLRQQLRRCRGCFEPGRCAVHSADAVGAHRGLRPVPALPAAVRLRVHSDAEPRQRVRLAVVRPRHLHQHLILRRRARDRRLGVWGIGDLEIWLGDSGVGVNHHPLLVQCGCVLHHLLACFEVLGLPLLHVVLLLLDCIALQTFEVRSGIHVPVGKLLQSRLLFQRWHQDVQM